MKQHFTENKFTNGEDMFRQGVLLNAIDLNKTEFAISYDDFDKNNTLLRPFLKWAGGKSQILPIIRSKYPDELGKKISKYAEPFVGGGAVLFDILNFYSLKEIYISDINAELINTYQVIRDEIDALISALTEFQDDYILLNEEKRKECYIEKRTRFNSLKDSFGASDNIEKAALFIFLNRTCFNGLYRVNKSGYFNVPAGKYKNPTICDEKNLRNISEAIKNINIVCADYQKSYDFIDENTFVYFDPPYRPITESSNFTSYTEKLFDDKSQMELAEFINSINKKGAAILLSNSDPKNSDYNDDFFDALYNSYNIDRVGVTRSINCNGRSRGKISELLITNHKAGDCKSEEEL
ncbi:DNA adenine methylase [Anaerotignum faecicola]|nr:DNA adenine methylase [Anaerotignum faecicola]